MPTISPTSRPAYVYDSQTDQWIPVGIGPHTHPNYIDQTLIDGKGDLLVGTAADTSGRLAVGTTGQVLVVDSATNTGLAWQTLDTFPDQTSNSGKFLTTNGTSVAWATIDALPSQGGNAGKFLSTDGTTASWQSIVTDPNPQIFMLMGA